MTRVHETVSVIICAYTERRWNDLVAAVDSLRKQTVPIEIIVVIDHNPVLLERAQATLEQAIVIANTSVPGASGARNTGVTVAQGQIIAFLDDDAEAYSDWIERLLAVYADATVLGVGGSVDPIWLGSKPHWFPEEFYWVIGGSYKGLPTTRTAVRNLWAGNMSLRREVFSAIDGFRTGFGKVGNQARPEDTDLCIRGSSYYPSGVWVLEPLARVYHKVPPSRATWRYFLSRCYAEGVGKAQLVHLVGSAAGLSVESRHVVFTLPRGVLHELHRAICERKPAALLRAGAIVAGLAAASTGYLAGILAAWRAKWPTAMGRRSHA
jgi:glycosyltransferase involved in cell wall biosynthesis